MAATAARERHALYVSTRSCARGSGSCLPAASIAIEASNNAAPCARRAAGSSRRMQASSSSVEQARGRRYSAEATKLFPANDPPSKKASKRKASDLAAANSRGISVRPVERTPAPASETELLDDREVPDADEATGEAEHALSQFLKLHPMLSLDSTSERTLACAAEIVSRAAVPTRELETVSKAHDDGFLRAAEAGERSCVNGTRCLCRWLAIFRYGEDTDMAFVGREYMLPSQLQEWRSKGKHPDVHQKCLLCTRYFTNYVYTLARTSTSFDPKSCVEVQAFGNAIGVQSSAEDALTHASQQGAAGGYSDRVMLHVDEKFAETAAARSSLGTMLWRPVVRFCSSDYVYEQVAGKVVIVQFRMGMEPLPLFREASDPVAGGSGASKR